jgi:hypothetical protein
MLVSPREYDALIWRLQTCVERLADRAISNSAQDQFPGHAITFAQYFERLHQRLIPVSKYSGIDSRSG